MRRSIRTRLLVTLIGLAVGPLLVVGVLLDWQIFTVQQQQAIALQHEVAARESTLVAAFVQQLENDLRSLVQVRGLKELPLDQQKSFLSELLSYRNAFDRIFLVDATGQEQAGASRTGLFTAADLRSRAQAEEFVGPTTSGRVYYSAVHTDSASGEPLMTIAVPLLNLRSGSADGVLVADVRFKPIQDLFSGVETTDQGVIYMVDSTKRVVAHVDPSVILKGTYFAPPAQDGIYTGLNGTSAVLATNSIHLGEQTFTIVTEKPTAVALALAINTLVIVTGLILIVLVIAVGVGLLGVRQIVRPIQALASTAQAIQQGDLSQKADVSSSDEFGQLARTFNAMTDAILHREKELRQQAEELRVATAKAKGSARVKGEFLANMSHELRTPLNAIIGFSDMLLMGMVGELTEQQKHKVERLRENGHRLLALINNVLDLTRIEARRIEIAQKPFSPAALAKRLIAQMEVLAQKNALDVKTGIDPELPASLVGDEQRIEQVVVNLLSNAFKFTDQGSVALEITANRAEHTWSLSVSDTGIGIPPHALDLIFEEFRQVDGSSSRAYKGSGLGLAITRNLVRVMDGQISVKSELGKGSTFTVTLPMLEEAPGNTVLQFEAMGA